ncbi:heavy metal-associated isoprenylated plant protein 32 [Sesamum indicum]|uniref:Heavy metal-associated isoprenylated plant protein 32 n=1 Tax=Sesamum indicum TaxID=4182 RepID=A0A6I9TRJ9_SESIN|nr:heavy metal-associated isoprenylated plant protein 32 [Sesamum indicum]
MNKQDMLKIQTCVLRVNIHCDGCKHKVKKKLQKIEGVYKVSIDVEQGKVTVSGNVDPATLIKKLEKAGKHAELWGGQKGPISIMKDIQIHNFKGGKDSKTEKGGFQAPQLKKDMRFLGKDQQSVKFSSPPKEEDDDFSDFDEDEEDEFDEGFGALQPPSKVAPVADRGGHGPLANKATSHVHLKGNDGANNGGNGKKAGPFNAFLKGVLGKAGGRTVGKSRNKAGNQDEGGKYRGKDGGLEPREGKMGAKDGAHKTGGGDGKTNVSWNKKKGDFMVGGDGKTNESGNKKRGDFMVGGNGKTNGSWNNKLGENVDGGPKLDVKQQKFNEINADYNGGGGINTGLMGPMGNFPAVQGLPAASAVNAGHFQRNPYNQQYMAQMMMMNRQHGHGQGQDPSHLSMYMQPQPTMSYGPPPVTDQYAHIFSDENTSSCSVM